MCLYPKLIPNPKYKTSKKRGYYVPKMHDNRLSYVPVACGKCFECRKKKAREWNIRLSEDIRHFKAWFITLTIDDTNMNKIMQEMGIESPKNNENSIAGFALRRFLERVRKKTKKSIRHWCVTELGEDRGRIHLHGIFFGEKAPEQIIEHWKYGFVFIGTFVSERTINYITKYMLKYDIKHREFSGKVFTSAGIGSGYFERTDYINNRYKKNETNETYRYRNGRKAMLPRYYRDKIYTEDEKEYLWLEKLDKGITWVMGEKCKIDSDTYENLMNYYREKCRQIHGDNQILWKEKQYWRRIEKQREAYRKRTKPREYTKEDIQVTTEMLIYENCPF